MINSRVYAGHHNLWRYGVYVLYLFIFEFHRESIVKPNLLQTFQCLHRFGLLYIRNSNVNLPKKCTEKMYIAENGGLR